MTSLQLDRNNWLEAKRHNAVGEAENQRHNQEMERLTGESNAETERAHRAAEAQAASNLAETIRHAQQAEALQASSIQETQRSNLAKEAENALHDRNMEKVQGYVAVSNSKQGWAKLGIDKQRALYDNALTAEKTLAEKISNYIMSVKAKAGLPKLEVAKLQAELGRIKQQNRNDRAQLELQEERQERELTLKEKEVESENNRRNFQNTLDSLKFMKDLLKDVLPIVSSAMGEDVPVT